MSDNAELLVLGWQRDVVVGVVCGLEVGTMKTPTQLTKGCAFVEGAASFPQIPG